MKRLLESAKTGLAIVLVAGFAWGQNLISGGGGMAASALATAAVDATGWTYNGTQSLATKDAAIPTNNFLFLDGASRVNGLRFDGTDIIVGTTSRFRPNTDQQWSLGAAGTRVSQTFTHDLMMGESGVRTLASAAPTITSACTTSPSITHGNAVSFQMDVGTGCGSDSTVVLGLPAATNGWGCSARHKTTAREALAILACAQDTTTAITCTNYGRTTGLPVDFVDADDLVINCMGR